MVKPVPFFKAMVKDINLVVSLSDQIFQFAQFSVVAKVTAVKVSVHGEAPKEVKERDEGKKKNGNERKSPSVLQMCFRGSVLTGNLTGSAWRR